MRKNGKKGNGLTQGVLNGLENPDATGLQLAAIPAPAQEQKSYLIQDAGTNILARMRQVEEGERANTTRDKMAGNLVIEQGGARLMIGDYETLAPGGKFTLPPATGKLLDLVGIEMTQRGLIQKGMKAPIITIPLSRYMEIRGLTDRTAAREQVARSCSVLLNCKYTYEQKEGSHLQSYFGFNVVDAASVQRGKIIFRFGQTFYDTLAFNGSILEYPERLLATNDRRNPHSYPLGRKLMEHKRMNGDKPNADIISVRTLVAAAAELPAYNDVLKSGRQVSRLIRDPFERDLDALKDLGVLTWEYCRKNGEPLTQEEIDSTKYETWIELLIHVYWPDDQGRTAKKSASTAKARKSRGAARTLKGGAAKGSTGARNEG